MSGDPAHAAAVAAAIGFGVIAVFQLALALGAPLGRAAWGGTHTTTLPARLRVASAVAAGVWVLAALIVLARGGVAIVDLPRGLVRVGTWVLVGLLALGSLVNFASRSRWERFLWGPVALLLAVLCFVLGRSGLPG